MRLSVASALLAALLALGLPARVGPSGAWAQQAPCNPAVQVCR